MWMTLELVGRDDRISLVDGENCHLAARGWAPAVAPRRRTRLGGGAPYEDVAERIDVSIFSRESSQDALAFLERLSALLDQADAWSEERLGAGAPRGNTPPVLLRVRTQGSSEPETPECIVIGRDDTEPLVGLPVEFNDYLMVWEVGVVRIQFMRRGRYLLDGTVAGAGAEANPTFHRVAMPEVPVPGPVSLRIGGLPSGMAFATTQPAFLMFCDAPLSTSAGFNTRVFNASQMVATNLTSVSDTASHAAGGSILRLDAAANLSGLARVAGVASPYPRMYGVATIRNNSSTTSFRVRLVAFGYGGARTGEGAWAICPPTTGKTTAVSLGMIAAVEGGLHDLAVEIEAHGSTGTFDLNVLAVMPATMWSEVISIPASAAGTGVAYNRELVLDHRESTHYAPTLRLEVAV